MRSTRRTLVRMFVMMVACTAAAAVPAHADDDRPLDHVPAERLARLARGVNVSHWLWLPQRPGRDHRQAYFTAADVELLRDLGMTHVRLPIAPDLIWDKQEERLRDDQDVVQQAIAMITSGGLAVVVDLHANQRSDFVVDERGRLPELERLWTALSTALQATDPEMVFLEIVNEPHDMPAGAWATAQPPIAAAIRAAAPRHTIIATGDRWGSIEGLVALEQPLDDRNVIYSFHFYEPHNFTHQGATWGFPPWRHMKDLPWPATTEELSAAADKIPDEAAQRAIRWSARQPWTAEFIHGRIESAAAWGRQHGVPLYCGEFGVYRQHSPPESRLRWLTDTRTALEAHNIGWAMWDYAGGFALTSGPAGSRQPDPGTLDALGLKQAATDERE